MNKTFAYYLGVIVGFVCTCIGIVCWVLGMGILSFIISFALLSVGSLFVSKL